MKFNLDRVIDELPPGLDRAILRVLSFHRGRSKAIGRTELVNAINAHGFSVNERTARAQISQLRKAGYLICAASGESGGYYLPLDASEFEEFVATEYRAKINDMQETLSAMQKAARRQFGEYSAERQGSLF